MRRRVDDPFLLGIDLEAFRDKSPPIGLVSIGAHLSFHHGAAEASLPAQKRVDFANDLKLILSKERFFLPMMSSGAGYSGISRP